MLVYLGLFEKNNNGNKNERATKVNEKIYNLIGIYQIFVLLYFLKLICLKLTILKFEFLLFVFLSPDEVVLLKHITLVPINSTYMCLVSVLTLKSFWKTL